MQEAKQDARTNSSFKPGNFSLNRLISLFLFLFLLLFEFFLKFRRPLSFAKLTTVTLLRGFYIASRRRSRIITTGIIIVLTVGSIVIIPARPVIIVASLGTSIVVPRRHIPIITSWWRSDHHRPPSVPTPITAPIIRNRRSLVSDHGFFVNTSAQGRKRQSDEGKKGDLKWVHKS